MSTDNPSDLLYTKEHEWARRQGDGNVIAIGITQFAVEQLGDITMVELPSAGDTVTKGQVFGSIESVKAVSDLFAPITGKVTAVNTELDSVPESVNDAPYEAGWLIDIEIEKTDEVAELMSPESYAAFVAEQD